MKIGETTILKAYLGTLELNASNAFLGETPIIGMDCLKFVSTGNSTIALTATNASPDLEYSLDRGATWTAWDYSAISLADGESVLFKGDNENGFSSGESSFSKFVMTGSLSASGNIMSLLDNGFGTTKVIPCTHCFYGLFDGCSALTSPPKLSATTITGQCYKNMFQDCSSLMSVPELPALVLETECYLRMFSGCTSLTAGGELPATTLAARCYYSMFMGCTSLISAPELSNTTLANACYEQMFQNCTALIIAPALPARTLISKCYRRMFDGCTSLNSVSCSATDISANACTSSWLAGVAANGTFYKEEDTAWTTGDNGIPTGWTTVDFAAPIVHLPLASNGDTTERKSGNTPVIGSHGSMTWDSSKGMYKFVVEGSAFDYAAKWEFPADKKTFTASSTGLTLALDVEQESTEGNTYANWAGTADLNEVFNGSGKEVIKRTASICPARYGSYLYGSIPLHRYAVTLNFGTKQIKFYRDGVLIKTQENWAGGAISDVTTINYFPVCQLQTNNYALSMWAKNLKIYDFKMTDQEVADEYSRNVP